MSWKQRSGTPEKIKIKLEIDVNPPQYFINEIKTHKFPISFCVNIQDLSSLFAGKCHALLCRAYEKGRDWFDFKWFVDNRIKPNYKYLDAMLNQQGQWQDQNVNSNKNWLSSELYKKIEEVNIDDINKDIVRFTSDKNLLVLDKNMIINIIHEFSSPNYG